jgi:hypothetical protein
MMADQSGAMLSRALQISQELQVIAESGDLREVADLGAERLRLLKAARNGSAQADANQRSLLTEISRLNDTAIGFLEHRRRIKEREIDTAAVGRRAVAAYSTTSPGR